MWQFYVLPWVFCELLVPKFQGRKSKFRTNSVNVFPFIPSSRYFKGSKLFPQCKYWLSKPRKRNMPQFWEFQLFFPQPTTLHWIHRSRTNLKMPEICYLAYFYCLFCKRIKFRYLRVIFWCWHLYKPESPESKYQISFHAFWNLRLPKWNSALLIFSQLFIISPQSACNILCKSQCFWYWELCYKYPTCQIQTFKFEIRHSASSGA